MLGLGDKRHFRGKHFCFMFKTIFLDATKFGGHKQLGVGHWPRMLPCGYGPGLNTSGAVKIEGKHVDNYCTQVSAAPSAQDFRFGGNIFAWCLKEIFPDTTKFGGNCPRMPSRGHGPVCTSIYLKKICCDNYCIANFVPDDRGYERNLALILVLNKNRVWETWMTMHVHEGKTCLFWTFGNTCICALSEALPDMTTFIN